MSNSGSSLASLRLTLLGAASRVPLELDSLHCSRFLVCVLSSSFTLPDLREYDLVFDASETGTACKEWGSESMALGLMEELRVCLGCCVGYVFGHVEARVLIFESVWFQLGCLFRFATSSSSRLSVRLRLSLLPFSPFKLFSASFADCNSSSIKGICFRIHCSNILWRFVPDRAILYCFV